MTIPRCLFLAGSSLSPLRAGFRCCAGWRSPWLSVRPRAITQLGARGGFDFIAQHHRCLSSTVESVLDCETEQLYDDGKLAEKKAALQLALSQLVGDFDRESMLSLRRFFVSRYTPVISTGSLKLDQALGIGGLPKGRIVEIYGKEASGKTTLALHVIKEAQKRGGCCAYLNLENSLDPSFAESVGVDTEGLLCARPSSAENSLSVVNTLVNSGSIDVIVVDSVAALIPQHELERVIDLTSQEMQSRLMTQALRKIYHSLSRSQTLLVLVNQVRSNLKQVIGHVGEITCGGNAVKFYSAIRLRTSRVGLFQTEDEITGVNISVQVIKNKLAPAMRKAELCLEFSRGIRHEAEILEMASHYGVILRERNGYWIQGEFLRDKAEAEKYIAQNSNLADELVSTLRSQLFEL